MEGLLAAFGINQTPAAEPTPEPPAEKTEVPAPESPPATETPAPAAGSEQQPQNPPEEKDKKPAPELPLENLNKQAHAFAEMRKTISEQNKVLEDIGKVLGVSGKPEEILAGLQKVTNAQKAKDAGIPPEFMARLTALEQEKAQRDVEDRKLRTYAAINNFQRNMGLDQNQLNAFLTQLAQAGKNPFESDVDLRSEYLVMNFDRLQQEAIQKALEKQAALDTKAQTQGTNPGTKTGGGDNKTTEIKTMDGLDAFLKANIK
jgi:hypothetical protein